MPPPSPGFLCDQRIPQLMTSRPPPPFYPSPPQSQVCAVTNLEEVLVITATQPISPSPKGEMGPIRILGGLRSFLRVPTISA